jgi:hypothetical protein
MERPAPRLVAGLVAAALAACGGAAPPTIATVAIERALPAPPSSAPDQEHVAAPALHEIHGIGPIHVGQSKEQVVQILGRVSRVVSWEDEKSAFARADHLPDTNVIFAVGFDEVLVWDNPSEGMTIPFWKVYLRGGKVATIVLSASAWMAPSTVKVGFPPACFLRGDAKGIAATFGPPLITRDQNVYHHYLARGLTIIEVRGEITVFDIYGPLSDEERERVERAVTGR